jgi:endonuclease/exonuclease/phosphatase family metal-dependent hydrolase
VFSRAASRAIAGLGYPTLVAGPPRSEQRPASDAEPLPGSRRPQHGELGLKLGTSGLVIVSEYPVVSRDARPFPRESCAGRDCLANKGMLHARIAIPGVPVTIDLFNTHMNSQRASRVPERRHLASHQTQADALSAYLVERGDFSGPLVFGGDFNMRHSEARFAEFQRLQPLEIVHVWCAEPANGCDVLMSWDGDEPWMDTQDLQLFWSGGGVRIRPVRVEAMFDGADQPRLSDHDGFLVTYELSWPTDRTLARGACPQARHGRHAGDAGMNAHRHRS